MVLVLVLLVWMMMMVMRMMWLIPAMPRDGGQVREIKRQRSLAIASHHVVHTQGRSRSTVHAPQERMVVVVILRVVVTVVKCSHRSSAVIPGSASGQALLCHGHLLSMANVREM